MLLRVETLPFLFPVPLVLVVTPGLLLYSGPHRFLLVTSSGPLWCLGCPFLVPVGGPLFC